MKWLVCAIVFLFSSGAFLWGQDTIAITPDNKLLGVIVNGDTLLLSTIDEVFIYKKPTFKTRRQWRRYNRLVRNVKKVYPYAKLAGEKYDTVSRNLMALESRREQRLYINQVEKEIKEEFEGDLRNLTISQGHILIKLLDREIGETSYDLLKELKGTFSAVFWQTLARLFGHNLKNEFDPDYEDKLLNQIVLLIEAGQL